MKVKEIENLESYFKTENEHWNSFAFKMLCEVLQQGQFENPEVPLQLFSNSIDIFTEHYESPLKAVELFAVELVKNKLTGRQKLFVYEWVCKYLYGSEFDFDLAPIIDLLKSQKEKLATETLPIKPLVKDIRENLKELMRKEIEQLPETMAKLHPIQRINILCKLMPYVFPKVEVVDSEKGEPGNW